MFHRILNKISSLISGSAVAAKPVPGQLPAAWQKYADYLDIHPDALIAPTSTLSVYFTPGKGDIILRIGAHSHIFGHFALLRPGASISIGARCQIGASHFIAADRISVGDDTLMAWGCTLMDTDSHAASWQDRKNDVMDCYHAYLANPANMLSSKNWAGIACAPIAVGSRCWIGFNASILKGVTLGPETIVGAASVITKSFAGNGALAGNPARPISTDSLRAQAAR